LNDSKRNYSSIRQSSILAKKQNTIKTNFNAVEINPNVLVTNKSSSAMYSKKSSLNGIEMEKRDNQSELKNVQYEETSI
jgi:hypothetical protein